MVIEVTKGSSSIGISRRHFALLMSFIVIVGQSPKWRGRHSQETKSPRMLPPVFKIVAKRSPSGSSAPIKPRNAGQARRSRTPLSSSLFLRVLAFSGVVNRETERHGC